LAIFSKNFQKNRDKKNQASGCPAAEARLITADAQVARALG
jgi:hypothetical protein